MSDTNDESMEPTDGQEETPVEPEEETAGTEEQPAEPETEPESETDGTPPAKKRWPWVVGGLIALFIIAFIPFYFTNSAASCGKCHSMTPYYTSWQKSWHGQNGTQCDQCHVRPGAFAYYTYRIGFYRELFAEVVGMKLAPWGATTPGESSCTRANCHSVNRLSSASGNIKVSHEIHVKVVEKKYNKACSYCHAGASHAGVKGLGSQLPPRRQCFVCHKDKVKQCDFCHTVKYKPGTVPKTPHF